MKEQRILPGAPWNMMILVLAMSFVTALTANAQTIVVLHTFDTEDAGDPTPIIEPGNPRFSGVIAQGRDGNLYSATPSGGVANSGAIYQMIPAGALGWVTSFSGKGFDGIDAVGGLTLGTDGNFYGTTLSGGASDLGTIFKVSSSGVLTTLHSFNGNDGAFPYAPPIEERDGNFYGVTQQGGTVFGAAYKITPAGVFTLLSTVPELPEAPLVLAMDGNFYGTATVGGTLSYGIVFRMTPAGAVTTIHTFDHTNGSVPVGPVIQGTDGLLYGTTSAGGPSGDGVVFKLTTGGKFTLLHPFSGLDGSIPLGGVVQASDGNFYGVTSTGGGLGFGAIYKITATGAFTLLASFDKTNNGTSPQLTLFQHTNGSLYGHTTDGGTWIEENGGGPIGGQGTFYSYSPGLAPSVSLVLAAGKVGTSVEILGQKFTGASKVSFNGVSASFAVVTDTYMTAKVPAGATKGTVTVIDGSGTVLTSSKVFVVVPNLISFSPTSGAVGSSVVLTGTGLTQTSIVTFGGVKATVFTVNSDSQITATVPTGAKTGKIAVNTPGGTATSSATFTVTP